MGSKKNKKQSSEAAEMISDPRFSSAHTDPRFRRQPRRESKVAIDSRFQGVFTDTDSAPVDKRGKRKKRASGTDSLLKEFYRIEEDDKKKEESGDESESESEPELLDLKSRKSEESSEEESKSKKKLGFLDEESDESAESGDDEEEEEEDTDEEDDEAFSEEDVFQIEEENIPNIEKETHRLAIVNMDWKHVSAKDLYVVLRSFLPKDGRLLSVAVYPTEFGLERMKEEEIHGPAIDGLKKSEDEDDDEEDEEEDEDEINLKWRAYEKSRLKYYHGVAEFDSVATADHLYKSCDGIEIERSSNKFDLRFIPDSMEFKHPPRDVATEAPGNYEGLDFHSRALQLSKVNITWDEDEPHRIKTLNQKFNPDQLAELELEEFIAFSSDESESDEDNDEGSKKEKKKQKYRALIESEDVYSDKDGEEENDQDMEVTFNTGLEDLSKNILKKKDKKSESVWEEYLNKRREKKRARKNKHKDDDSSSPDDDDDDYNIDRKAVKDDGVDDFFVEEPPLKKKKEGKTKKMKKASEEEVAAEERSRAELELLLADGNAGVAGNGLKGYNIKRRHKKGSKEIAEEKIPVADLDPRFSAIVSDPLYALDPTDPQFKRSATYVRQLAQKQKEDPKSHEEVKGKEKEELKSDGNLVSKKEKFDLLSTVKSVKRKMPHKDSDKIKAGNAESSSTLSQRLKEKVKALSKK